MLTRHYPLLIRCLLLNFLSLRGKVCFGVFAVRIAANFLLPLNFFHREVMWSFTVQWLPVWFLIFALAEIDP